MSAHKPAADPTEFPCVQSKSSIPQHLDRALVVLFVRDESLPSFSLQSSDRVPAEPTVDPVFIDELRKIGEVAEQDFLGELVTDFVHDTDTLVVQLRDALELKDAQRVGQIAHKIKGSAGQLGGRRLASSCARLETAALLGALTEDHFDLQELQVDYQELRLALRQASLPGQDSAGRLRR
jgi:HPt (histidine-containing phosphotransfer) domain-containing protein